MTNIFAHGPTRLDARESYTNRDLIVGMPAFRVRQMFQSHGPALSDRCVADSFQMPLKAALELVKELKEEGYLEFRAEQALWALTPKAYDVIKAHVPPGMDQSTAAGLLISQNTYLNSKAAVSSRSTVSN
ncbi:hypothetical protein FSB08_20175 [Paraburkholderia sp. JPY432]|uniref:hypothetical protein n=1 Tax=Paraburkholderia youngii TaxID=2782701 RepID=UPI00159602F2|nr:hypothetical protein [Paraburkholderia youngii]NVH74787.1 hypothetical protein [Paraburkholderia youngii]